MWHGWTCVAAVVLALAAQLPGSYAALATGDERAIVDPAVSGPAWIEPGQWRSKVQQVFDPATRTLTRRVYEVWDPEPSRGLDFDWTPDRIGADRSRRINGSGRLVWRIKGLPTYDQGSVFAEYRGKVRSGRIEGRGAYLDSSGLLYDGEWRDGLMHGQGTLKLPGGDEYTGSFRRGRADGKGRYVDITGEVYEGTFVNGLRHGRGSTTLPGGSRYASSWTMGKESENSQQIRFAQSGGASTGSDPNDIRVGISIRNQLPPSPDGAPSDDWRLRYSLSNLANGMVIRPNNQKLLGLWKGWANTKVPENERILDDQSNGTLSVSKEALPPLELTIEVQNRTSASISISGAYLDIQHSESDLQPAIQIDTWSHYPAPANCTGSSQYRPRFGLQNFGWGAAENAVLRFGFAGSPARNQTATPDNTLAIGKLAKAVTVDVEPALRSAGVNIDLLRRNTRRTLPCRASNESACLQDLRSSGLFGSTSGNIEIQDNTVILHLVGTLEYDWSDAGGRISRVVSRLRKEVRLGRVSPEEGGCAEEGSPETMTWVAQKLRLDAANYRIPVAYKSNIPVGRSSAMRLPIASDRSSHHLFRVVAQLSDGREVRSRPVDLLYYRPSWFLDSSARPDDVPLSAPSLAGAPTAWNHNGSTMRLVADGARRKFLYDSPRPGIISEGVTPGALLFDGVRNGEVYRGTAYIFSRRCGRRPYEVSGSVGADQRSVVMTGQAPVLGRNCEVVGSKADTLVFELLPGQ